MNVERIRNNIYELRGCKVMIDFDLAVLYQVKTKVLNQAVRRNIERFPEDFMFQLTLQEWGKLNDLKTNWSQIVTSSQKHRYKLPYAFTEQGISMLSSVLRSDVAIQVNMAIMRTFVFMRQYALTHIELTEKLEKLELKYNKQFKDIYEAINYLVEHDQATANNQPREQVGFKIAKQEIT